MASRKYVCLPHFLQRQNTILPVPIVSDPQVVHSEIRPCPPTHENIRAREIQEGVSFFHIQGGFHQRQKCFVFVFQIGMFLSQFLVGVCQLDNLV